MKIGMESLGVLKLQQACCKYKITERLRLEEDHQVQPPCSEQGQLQQVAQRCVQLRLQ